MERRDFLKGSAALAAFAALHDLAAAAENAAKGPGPDLVAVRNGEPVAMFRRAIEEYGGIGRVVKPGARVVIKPNIAWSQPPEMGANTTPELVGEVVRQCLAAGAASVEVFDHTCNNQDQCYDRSGVAEAVKAAGGKMRRGDRRSDYVTVEAPRAVRMKSAMLHRLVRDCDVFINMPVLKHHGGAQMTCCMKNLMGMVWDRGFMHQNDLHLCIADSVLLRQPDLNIVDAYRVMKAGGPRGSRLADVELKKYLLLGNDIVALDTAAAAIIGFPVDRIGHIAAAAKLGLGTADLSSRNIRRITL